MFDLKSLLPLVKSLKLVKILVKFITFELAIAFLAKVICRQDLQKQKSKPGNLLISTVKVFENTRKPIGYDFHTSPPLLGFFFSHEQIKSKIKGTAI